MRSRGLFLLALGVCSALLGSEARATTMVRASVEELAAVSALVVLGEVLETAAVRGEGPRGGIFTRVRLRVEERWRGELTSREVVFWTHGGEIGDRAMLTHGAATFTAGERVVVFLYDTGGGRLFVTGMSQGKWRVRNRVATSTADPSALVDGAGRTDAAPESLSVDALRARVNRSGR